MKTETRSTKFETSLKVETGNAKRYDLEGRCLVFAREARDFCYGLPKNVITNEDVKQLVRSSGSVGANYLEANESLSKKDFAMRIKIAKKEARETIYWLELLRVEEELMPKLKDLMREATEIMNILGAILRSTRV